MQQYLYLVRHAHAHDEAPSDALRPLSSKGREQLDRLAAGLIRSGRVDAHVIWQSGLLRARETAEALKRGLGLDVPIKQVDALGPYDSPRPLIASIDNLDTNCLIAGHEPNLSALAAILLTGSEEFQRITFPKASILCLSRLKVGTQATPWQIEWHISHHFFK